MRLFAPLLPGLNEKLPDGIPVLPIDDTGRRNAYPIMRVQAIDRSRRLTGTANTVMASTDVVLPVASEADCRNCHADQSVCDFAPSLGSVCTGVAVSRAEIGFVRNADAAPGDTSEQKVQNAAKINILLLHDAKHGTSLSVTRKVVCASCHYSTALDLAQLGPTSSAAITPATEQTRHIPMSRAT